MRLQVVQRRAMSLDSLFLEFQQTPRARLSTVTIQHLRDTKEQDLAVVRVQRRRYACLRRVAT